MSGIIVVIMRFIDSCCASAVGIADILLCTQVLTPTSTGRMKSGSALPRSSQRKCDSGGTTWSTSWGNQAYRCCERFMSPSGNAASAKLIEL